jgi:Lon protease-like protein
MDDAERVEKELHRLAIFPLPGAVLLPYALIPLHIFEPRYRKMIRDCASGSGVLALANLAEPESVRSGGGRPRVLPVVGAGVLARVEPLPDGRSNIVLRGVLRARIVEELDEGEPYRLVRAEALRDVVSAADAARAESLRRLALALCASRPGATWAAVAQMAARARDAGQLADAIAAAVIESPAERQGLLEQTSVSHRLARVEAAVAAALAETANASAPRN